MTATLARTRRIRLLLAALLALGIHAAAASAATPAVTAQAQVANAGFLAYAPPPSSGPGALCLVDTGVHANPDTTPGLVYSSALDGGTTDDVDPDGHGTTMAMIAGAAGNGVIGAWPQIKIVSVRATDVPSPGQEPSFEFNDYVQGIDRCLNLGAYRVDAIDLALSSTIPPSPDQAQDFANEIARANGLNIAVVAAAGNQPGAIEEPAVEPGVLAVGASTAQPNTVSETTPGAPCSFSASQGLTFFAPGCGLDEANATTDAAKCCGNGTSQASAFTAAVLVALMSYDTSLSYAKAEQLLLSTTTDGNLDVAAAFQADGLGAIVAAGNANIPQPPAPAPTPTPAPAAPTAPSTPAPTTPAAPAKPAAIKLTVKTARWQHGVLTLSVNGLDNRLLRVELYFPHGHVRHLTTHNTTIRIRTRRPRSVLLRVGTTKTTRPLKITIK